MKVRNGFVSNSSSSSFIIGIARVTDEKKLKKYINENNISYVNIVDLDYIKKSSLGFRIRDNKITLESFMSDVTTTFISENDKFVYLETCDGDDSDFWDGDEYDYDIDLDFFSVGEIDAYNLFDEKDIGIVDPETTYGAGRDG